MVKHPGHCRTFLPSAGGTTLRFHFAMCFGAAASVWNLNRAADAVQMVLRALLLVLFGHYVDDFNGTEDEPVADSAHCALADFLALLGLQTKRSKAQAPTRNHMVQNGVQVGGAAHLLLPVRLRLCRKGGHEEKGRPPAAEQARSPGGSLEAGASA